MNQDADAVRKPALSADVEKSAHSVQKQELTVPALSTNGVRKLRLELDPNSRVVFQGNIRGVATEQYRLLRRSLAQQFPQGATLAVTSPTKGDGKTVNAINLAWCLGETRTPTLLLEADLRQPSVAQVLGYRPQQGVESAMMNKVSPESTVVLVDNGMPLHVAAVTQALRDPIQILTRSAAKNYIEWARSRFHWVVLDFPPVIPAADVAELAPLTDGVLLVVRVRTTPLDLIEKSFRMLGGQVLGVILNEATLCLDTYDHYSSG